MLLHINAPVPSVRSMLVTSSSLLLHLAAEGKAYHSPQSIRRSKCRQPQPMPRIHDHLRCPPKLESCRFVRGSQLRGQVDANFSHLPSFTAYSTGRFSRFLQSSTWKRDGGRVGQFLQPVRQDMVWVEASSLAHSSSFFHTTRQAGLNHRTTKLMSTL